MKAWEEWKERYRKEGLEKQMLNNEQYLQGGGTVPTSISDGAEQIKYTADKVLRRAVPPGMNSYEQRLPQGQSKKLNLLRMGTVPPSNIEGVEQKASKQAWLLGRAVPPTTCTVM